MTSVLPLHVKIMDHVLSMDLQDIFVHVNLDIQALAVKVRHLYCFTKIAKMHEIDFRDLDQLEFNYAR